MNTAFTYQGVLLDGGSPLTGSYDFQFRLYNGSGQGPGQIGCASLVDGEARVGIDSTFAATVNLDESYHVFLTPLGDCTLYVAEKSATSFQVKAQGGATCSIDFDYRLVAKRKGYEDLRLESFDIKEEEE